MNSLNLADAYRSALVKHQLAQEDPLDQYIVWSPVSEKPPQKIFESYKQSQAVATNMACKHGTGFFIAQLVGYVNETHN